MARGDVTISIAVEGGVTKTITLDSATRVLAKSSPRIDTDAEWQVSEVNKMGNIIINRANVYGKENVSYTAKTFTAAT